MTFHDATTELRNYLRSNYDDDNVTAAGVGERPIIINHDEVDPDDTGGSYSLGKIIIGRERRRNEPQGYFYQSIRYELDITVEFETQSNRTLYTQTMTEIERIINLNTMTNFDRLELITSDDNNNTDLEVTELQVVLWDRLQPVVRG